MSKYKVGLKTLLQEGLSELKFYGDVVNKFRKVVGKNDSSVQFKKDCLSLGYNMDVKRQTVCMAVNPIMIDSFASLFNCTTVCRSSD